MSLRYFLYWMIHERGLPIEEARIRKIKFDGIDLDTTEASELLTQDDILKLLKSTTNPMYRCLIALLYESAGRPYEVVSLKWCDLTADGTGINAYSPVIRRMERDGSSD